MHICVSQLHKQLSRQLLGHGSLLMSKGQHPCRISRTCTVSMLTVTGVCTSIPVKCVIRLMVFIIITIYFLLYIALFSDLIHILFRFT